jgi:hypothetical protein
MRTINRLLFVALSAYLFVSFTGCSHGMPKRTKWTDKNLRVMIDPTQIDKDNYVKLQKALVQSGNFTVVDRAAGFAAIKAEQERLHRNEVDRYEDKEKWAHWGKLYGVGSIIVPHAECTRVTSGGIFHPGPRLRCFQSLSIVDANTGEVVSMIEDENFGERMENIYGNNYHVPEWDDAVELLVKAYPKDFDGRTYHPVLENYRNLSKEEAIRQKELVAKKRAPASTKKAADADDPELQ